MFNQKNVVKLIVALFFVGGSALTYASPDSGDGPKGVEGHDSGHHEVEMHESADVHAGYEDHEGHEMHEAHEHEGHDAHDRNDDHDDDHRGHDKDDGHDGHDGHNGHHGHDKDKRPTR